MNILATAVVMLINTVWGHSGGPAAIPGFQSMEACNAAIPQVQEFYGTANGRQIWIKCVVLPTAVEDDPAVRAEKAEYERLKKKFEAN